MPFCVYTSHVFQRYARNLEWEWVWNRYFRPLCHAADDPGKILLGHFNLFIQVHFPSITIPVPHNLKAWSRDLELEVGVDGVIHKFLCTAGHKKLMLYGIIMK